jgi:hypothetical protein
MPTSATTTDDKLSIQDLNTPWRVCADGKAHYLHPFRGKFLCLAKTTAKEQVRYNASGSPVNCSIRDFCARCLKTNLDRWASAKVRRPA